MMSAKPTIGVVITCYNYERYVGGCVSSVLNQTRKADEILVIEDGSTDNSRSVLASLSDRVKLIFKANEGYKAAINQGFRESTSDIIIFLDADDALHPDALECVEAVWCDGLAKVQYDLDIIDGTGRLLGRKFANFDRPVTPAEIRDSFRKTGTYRWPVTSGNAHARHFLEQVMPLIPPVGHDGVLNTIAPLYGGIITISRSLGFYRLHGQNMSLLSSKGVAGGHPDFARQIGFRQQEFKILRHHALRRGVSLPGGDLLNNELVFVNYRLMARKIGMPYPEEKADRVLGLWRRGFALALTSSDSAKIKLSNAIWLTALALSPGFFARFLVRLRFNRAQLFAALLGCLRSLYKAHSKSAKGLAP
jgi:glycosyltransferase involved in cell wall biosynthesis